MRAYLWRCAVCGYSIFDERRPRMRYTNHVCRFRCVQRVSLMKEEPDWPTKAEVTD